MNKCYSGEFSVNNQLYFCGIPFRLDSYSGCTHNCVYCFARANSVFNVSVTMHGNQDKIIPADPKYFISKLALVHRDFGESRNDINIEWLRHRVPIHFGGMSDPFQPCEHKYQVSLRYMEYLSFAQYPTVISTKATPMLLEPEYLALLKKGKYAVQTSLVCADDSLLAQLEPGAPSATARLEAVESLSAAGIWTAIRIQPMIPDTLIESDLGAFIARIAQAGVKHVLVEGYKASSNSDRTALMWQLFPGAINNFKYPDSERQSHEKLIPAWRKWKYVKAARALVHEYGMTFGAADNDLRDQGDVVCCCGIDNLPGFENFWKYQASQAAVIARAKGTVSLEDMQEYWSGGEARLDTGNTENYPEYQASRKAYRASKGRVAIQAGAMRDEFNATGVQHTAKACIDYTWARGGGNSPECMACMKRVQVEGKTAYQYQDPVPLLEAEDKEQLSLL